MTFDPRLKIGQILKNADLVDTFKCGNMGGMRRSKTTNTLVLITDYTKGIYGAFPDRPYDSPGVWGDATIINRILKDEQER